MIDRRAPWAPPAAMIDEAIGQAPLDDFERLDQLLLTQIGAGASLFMDIYSREVIDESDRIAAVTGSQFADMIGGFRIVEARLQHLKTVGAIAFRSGPGWSLGQRPADEPVPTLVPHLELAAAE